MNMENLAKRRADWKATMRIGGPMMMMMSTQKICQALQCTYQAKALAADDFALQVILLDPRSGSSEGKYRGDCHCIVVVFVVPVSLFVFQLLLLVRSGLIDL